MFKTDALNLIGRAGMMQAEILPELLTVAPVGSRWEKVYDLLEEIRDQISMIIIESDGLKNEPNSPT